MGVSPSIGRWLDGPLYSLNYLLGCTCNDAALQIVHGLLHHLPRPGPTHLEVPVATAMVGPSGWAAS